MYRHPYIVAFDPSFRNFGWAVIDVEEEPRVTAVGVIKTTKADKKLKAYQGEDDHRCCQEIASGLATLMSMYKPRLIVAEARAGSKNSRAASTMAAAWACLSSVAEVYEVPIIQARPQQIKKHMTGSAKASKTEVEDAVVKKFPELKKLIKEVSPKSAREHVYDAAASYVTCAKSTEVLTVLQMTKENLEIPKCDKCGKTMLKCKCPDNELEK